MIANGTEETPESTHICVYSLTPAFRHVRAVRPFLSVAGDARDGVSLLEYGEA